MSDWIRTVTTTSVYEGPPGTMGRDKTPRQMARVLLKVNPTKTRGSILRYMQFFINRAGRNLPDDHKKRIQEAMAIIRHSKHEGDKKK